MRRYIHSDEGYGKKEVKDVIYDDKLKKYKRIAIKTAKDLRYNKCIISEIENAKTTDEISSIMCKNRHEKFG